MLTAKHHKPNLNELTVQDVVHERLIATTERELTPAPKGDCPLCLILRTEKPKDPEPDVRAEGMIAPMGPPLPSDVRPRALKQTATAREWVGWA